MIFLENTVKFRMKTLSFGQPWFILGSWDIIVGKWVFDLGREGDWGVISVGL